MSVSTSEKTWILLVLTFCVEYDGSDNYIATSCYLIDEEKTKVVNAEVEEALEAFNSREVDHDDEFFNFFTEDKKYIDANNLNLSDKTISRIHFEVANKKL